MAERDPRCVFVSQDRPTAAALAEWLSGKGFPAEVLDSGVPGETGDALGFSSTAVGGYEVRLLDAAQLEAARELLTEYAAALEQMRSVNQRRAERTGTVAVVCDECGKSSDWPASRMGTTENCPHCQEFMDIPDPDDDTWAGVDFGTYEDEETEK